jgi:hypothetical protein
MTDSPESETKSPRKPRPWLLWVYVTLAFVVLISAWTLLIFIATQNQPELIE